MNASGWAMAPLLGGGRLDQVLRSVRLARKLVWRCWIRLGTVYRQRLLRKSSCLLKKRLRPLVSGGGGKGGDSDAPPVPPPHSREDCLVLKSRVYLRGSAFLGGTSLLTHICGPARGSGGACIRTGKGAALSGVNCQAWPLSHTCPFL